MPAIDRNAALSVLYPAKTVADGKLTFYRTQPYPAMLTIAEDRAYTLDLLIEAIDNGLLERLVAEQAGAAELAEARVQVEQAAANAPEKPANGYCLTHGLPRGENGYCAYSDPNADADDEDGDESRFTRAQLDGEACTECGAELAEGEATVPSGYGFIEGQLLAHLRCVPEVEAASVPAPRDGEQADGGAL